MAKPEFDLVVIGGGSGGLVVAAGGAALGAKVALVEKHKLGGDCLWYGCVPSKTLIKSARIAHEMRHADRWALAPADPQSRSRARHGARRARDRGDRAPRQPRALSRPRRRRRSSAAARFVAPDAFEVDGRRLTAKTFVIATGSRPAVPPIPGLDATSPISPTRPCSTCASRCRSLIVVGAGPIGCEMAQAFRRLGSEVTVVDMAPQILPREDADLAAVVEKQLRAEGIRFHLGRDGRRCHDRRSAAGRIRVTVRGRDGTVAQIVGDASAARRRAAGEHRRPRPRSGAACASTRAASSSTTAAHDQSPHLRRSATSRAATSSRTSPSTMPASCCARRSSGCKWAKPSRVVPWCTYTDPELARVGLSETEARKQGVAHRVYRFPFDEIDRARAEGETEGFAKIVTDPQGQAPRRGDRRPARRRADRRVRAGDRARA